MNGKINEDEVCGSGLYFTNLENIHKYYNYGTILCIIKIPKLHNLIFAKDIIFNKYKANYVYITEMHSLTNYNTYLKFKLPIFALLNDRYDNENETNYK